MSELFLKICRRWVVTSERAKELNADKLASCFPQPTKMLPLCSANRRQEVRCSSVKVSTISDDDQSRVTFSVLGNLMADILVRKRAIYRN